MMFTSTNIGKNNLLVPVYYKMFLLNQELEMKFIYTTLWCLNVCLGPYETFMTEFFYEKT